MNPTAAQRLPLNDIHLPETIGFWPLAMGWWLLIAMSLVLLILLCKAWQRYQGQWRYRRSALRQLRQSYRHWQQNPHQRQQALYKMLTLLKRTAITAYPSAHVASLSGDGWLIFLNQKTRKPCFNEELQKTIAITQYQADSHIDINALYHACNQWIKQHRLQHQNPPEEALAEQKVTP